jgi:acyl carrier protein
VTNITEHIRDYIIHNFLFDDAESMLPDEASLIHNGIIDSTGVLDLIVFVEDAFNLTVGEEDLVPENFDSVKNMAQYVARRVGVPMEARVAA